MSTPHINDLKSRVGDLERQLSDAKARLLEAEIAAAPVKLGDTVIYRGIEHRITQIIPSWQKVWLKGNPKKKDGTWGSAIRALYNDWEIPASGNAP